MLIEVLSPTTADYDHGRKFAHYRGLPSLKVYLLIAHDEVWAGLFVRQSDDRWLLTETTDPAATLELPVVEATLDLARVYDGVSRPGGAGESG